MSSNYQPIADVPEQPYEAPFLDTPEFTRPKPSIDREAPRYLGFIGNVVDPDRAQELDYVRGGGIEVQNPCLKFVRQFIRRGRITPLLENTHDPLPIECTGEGKNSDVYALPGGGAPGQIRLGDSPEAMPGIVEASALVGWRCYPGEQVNMILNGSPNMHRNQKRGIVELTPLFGHQYKLENLGNGIVFDREIWAIQRALFPDYPRVPILLSESRALLDRAYRESKGDLKTIAQQWLVSCEQFGRWAGTLIERIHVLMRKGATELGEVHSYSGVELVLLEQLGIPRQDEQLKNIANQTQQFMQGLGNMATNQGISTTEVVKLIQDSNAQSQANFLAALRELKGEPAAPVNIVAEPTLDGVALDGEPPVPQIGFEPINETTMQAVPEAPEYVCECGKSFPTPQGRALHKTRHCELTNKN